MSKRRTPQEKARIVLEFLNTGASAAELCRKHNVSPATFQDWKDKFMEGGKQALAGPGGHGQDPRKRGGEPQAHNRRDHRGQRHFKKNFGGSKAMKMKAVGEAGEYMSLNKALQYCGVSKCAWHYTKKPRTIPLDAGLTCKVREIASRRPTYGTRRMAAQISRETGVPTSRKKIQRIYRKIGWSEPQKAKRHNPNVQTREIQANRTQPAVGDGYHVHPLRQGRVVLLLQRPGRIHQKVGSLHV